MEVAALVRNARRRHGLSQRALADASGVAQPVIARIEAGRQNPGMPVIAKILSGLGESLVLSTEPVADPHDLGLLEVTLQLAPKERVDRLVMLHRTATRLQAGAGR